MIPMEQYPEVKSLSQAVEGLSIGFVLFPYFEGVFFCLFFILLGPHLQHMEVPRLGSN